ncbi:MAG: hypothetical protein ABSE82_03565 [Nitrososphaerales archaeon]|jgi:hypothetical protein
MSVTTIYHTNQTEGARALASLLKAVSLGDVTILSCVYDGQFTITVKHER